MTDALTATLEWHDRFDKAFGVTASDCSEFLDWPGKTAPFSEQIIEEMTGSEGGTDWDFMNRFRGQVKFDVFKSELIQANPGLEALDAVKVIFLMRSAGDARLMRDLEGGVILADALWLSFASFCVQSQFATFPQLHEPNAENDRLMVATHFALRALLYQEILRGDPLDKAPYKLIWETWPTRSDADPGAPVFLWTGLGRFIVAHELAHILLHAPENCTIAGVERRGIVPMDWIWALQRFDAGLAIEDYVYEIEADMQALRMCENFLADHPQLRSVLVAGAYYMFLCLEELANRVGAKSVFPQRRYCVGQYLAAQSLAGQQLAEETEAQFIGRAKFYFGMSEHFRAA